MNFLDATTLFDRSQADLAVLSTYQFDPAFFESRLLRCTSLASARRIVVLMDAGQLTKLLRDEVPARLINRRYLVVPVAAARGVFHPKLNLLMTSTGAQVQCGSNNLTRPGYSSNLELLNALEFDLPEKADKQAIRIAQEAFRFFEMVLDDIPSQPARIAQEWLGEFKSEASWLAANLDEREERVRLLATHEGSIWDQLTSIWDRCKPSRFLVISPFYDTDGEMLRRLCKLFPRAQIELVAQQTTSNPPLGLVKRWASRVTLSELRDFKRCLHAKLLYWESHKGSGCLVGSANFTRAAFDGRNVEACLAIDGCTELTEALFDSKFTKRPIDPGKFKLGIESEPEAESMEPESFWIDSASISANGVLSVEYGHRLATSPRKLWVEVRSPSDSTAPVNFSVPNQHVGAVTHDISTDLLASWHGSIIATLAAEVGSKTQRSLPAWVIQGDKLTHESGDSTSGKVHRRIEETGEGLLEYLDQLGERTDLATVIEYLNSVTVAFYDGVEVSPWRWSRRGAVRDPFQPDTPADWLTQNGEDGPRFLKAFHDFIERHEKLRLQRHAQRGNINGMANFLDIFVMLVQLLYVYYQRGSIKRGELIDYGLRMLKIAAYGYETNDDFSNGFLVSIWENMGRDPTELLAANTELNLTGYLLATLAIVQQVRFVPNEKLPGMPTVSSPSCCLLNDKREITEALDLVDLGIPSDQSVLSALRGLGLFNGLELLRFQYQLMGAEMFHEYRSGARTKSGGS